ncbi:MAG: 4-alpha-glucanotransferase [Dorea sp.]
MNRTAGILLPITSLPSKYGIGGFSKKAYEFVDWLKEAGQCNWQILPLVPTSYGDSPYQSFSTYAGNPYLIDLDELIAEGVLTEEEVAAEDFGSDPSDIDYEKIYISYYKLLRMAYERSNISRNWEYNQFVEENAWWLKDYALFMAVKGRFGGKAWTEWAEDIRLRYGYSVEYYQRELYFDIEFQQYMQYVFFKQWNALKQYANDNGINIIGDIPIYVAMDSADVWANPELFQLDENNVPTAVAGCPPDGFSATGQLWGNPLYRWDYHRNTGFGWWMGRLAHAFRMYDIVRIDHFRGFDEYYTIPYGETSAINGAWKNGPGIEIFWKMFEVLGEHKVIAEDLGYVTDSVRRLVKESEFPGMKVFEFAFDSRDTGSANDYLPHNYAENSVAYTGTHDNETLTGWFASISDEERSMARKYVCDETTPDDQIYWRFICEVMKSHSHMCIVPMQDYLGLDNTARTNKPSTVGTNWRWRVTEEQLSDKLKKDIREITRRYGRLCWQWQEELDK